MKFTITTEAFKPVIAALSGIAGGRMTLPILSNVLIDALGSTIKFTASNLDVEISISAEASGVIAGITTTPAKRLFDLIRALPSGELEIESTDKETLKITSGSAFYELNGLSAEEFPKSMELGNAKSMSIDKLFIKNALRKSIPCVAVEESRGIMQCVCFQCKGATLFVIATDGRRLFKDEVAIEFKGDAEAMLPADGCAALNNIADGDGSVELILADNHAKFVSGKTVVIAKLMEGYYCNWRQVVPSETKQSVKLPRETVLAIVKRVMLMTSEANFSVRLEFGKNTLAISANSATNGSGRETLAIDYKGKEIVIAFSPKYLIDALATLSETEVSINLIDSLSPATITTTGAFVHILMPMRVS